MAFIIESESPQTLQGGIEVQADGDVLLGGTVQTSGTSPGGPAALALFRLNADGTLDTGFGDTGRVLADFGSSNNQDQFGSVLLQPADGSIVLTGVSSKGFSLARFIGGGSSTAFPTSTRPQVGPITTPAPPVAIGTTVTVSASFAYDSSHGSCTAVWNWGDGTTSAGTVAEANGSGSVAASHVYHVGGAYPVTLTVTDSDGASGKSTAVPGVVVWQPVTGRLTGNLHLFSPLDSLPSDPSFTGNATLQLQADFSANGAPKGKVSLKLKAAHLSFKSTGIDWLAINGRGLLLQGRGTIDGTEAVRFFVSATGGSGSGKIRIRVWDQATGAVVYDSQPGALLDAAPAATVRGETIALHVARPRRRSKP